LNPPAPVAEPRPRRHPWHPAFLALGVAAVAATTFTAAPVGQAQAAATTRVRARVIQWIDGDTVRTTKGTIRLIGMDTPERGARCYRQARSNAARLAPAGSRITLVSVARRDSLDRYGRKLRYVQRNGVDVGLRQIRAGYADARYDAGSYGTHPRRATYRRADARHPDRRCVSTPRPPTRPPSPACDPSYPTVCIPPPPPDLDCGDIPYRYFTVVGSDPHRFDGTDNDGIGCES
jgi:micrococcal nuclease